MKIAPICLAGVSTFTAFSPALRAADVPAAGPSGAQMTPMSPAQYNNWLTRWKNSIISDSANRYCDTAMGEDIGWLMQPFLDGYYNGYMLTKDPSWVGRLVDWTDSWVKRGVVEPDGYIGWPKLGAAGTDVDNLNSFYADSLLGEAMVLRPIVLMSQQIINTPSLNAIYGAKAQSYL